MHGMKLHVKYPDFKARLVDAIGKCEPSINAIRAQARKSALNMKTPAGFTAAFNERFKGTPITSRVAGNWLNGRNLPSKAYRAHLETLLHEKFYYLKHGVRPGDAAQALIEAGEPVLNYVELPRSLQIDPFLEMLTVEEKEPIKDIVRQLNTLVGVLLNKKRPD